MADLLLEILSEEIPARMQLKASQDLKKLTEDKLSGAGLSFGHVDVWSTPRRLALYIKDLPQKLDGYTEERRGPQLGAPEKALNGFMKANNLDDISKAKQKEVKGKTYYFAEQIISEQQTADLIKSEIPNILHSLPWPKSMRFLGQGNTTKWVRPIRSILCLFDNEIIDFEFGGQKAGRQTFGHRFMSPEPLDILDAQDYEKSLFEAMVIVNRQTRKDSIARALDEICEANNLSLNKDEALLNEVTGLVEWPHIILGSIDAQFMELPAEVLIDTLKDHQKYFTLNDQQKSLSPHFITVANMVTMDPEIICAGNERVLRARLYDAKFFWDQDRKNTLESRLPALKKMLFQAELGNQYERSIRLSHLAKEYANLTQANQNQAARAALLSKADLVTGMVFEIPEVQGIIGQYYALHDGEDAAVAQAIKDHYKPAGMNDIVPSQPVSMALALADKMDTLIGFWTIGKKPTGSGDPFALRRSALGIIRLLNDNQSLIALTQWIQLSITAWKDSQILTTDQLQNIEAELLAFFSERMRITLKEAGFNTDIGHALLAATSLQLTSKNFTPFLIMQRATALQSFLETEDGINMLSGLKRAGNIVTAEEKKHKTRYKQSPQKDHLSETPEKDLFDALERAKTTITHALSQRDFTKAMAEVAKLRHPIDCFLDNVMVNVDDNSIRENRLNLLASIGKSLDEVADFSKLV